MGVKLDPLAVRGAAKEWVRTSDQVEGAVKDLQNCADSAPNFPAELAGEVTAFCNFWITQTKVTSGLANELAEKLDKAAESLTSIDHRAAAELGEWLCPSPGSGPAAAKGDTGFFGGGGFGGGSGGGW